MPAPTYDELARLVVEQAETITRLKARIAEQDARIAELERQVTATSRNSSKPPSSDGLGKPVPRSLRTRSGRKPGGQPGHPGQTLAQTAMPDHVRRHEPVCCRGCGHDLADAEQAGMTRRQVFDLPPTRIQVTEHQLISRRCPCGATTTADAPTGVTAPVQYGPQIAAVIVYLYMGQYLSKNRTARAISELFNTPVSEATVAAVTSRAGQDLEGFTDAVTDRLADADIVHFDETGFRVAGRLHWLHSASTDWWTLITCHHRRGHVAMDDAGILPEFTGIAVHDAWAPYDTYTDATHALCNAHVLRELIAVTDYHHAHADPDTWCWAQQVIDSLLNLKDLTETGPIPVDPDQFAEHRRRILHASRIGATQSPPGKVGAKHAALARRIDGRIADYLRFATDPTVPFDNNAAEREIRMATLRQKISGSMRTLTGARHFAALRSYLATTTKHGIANIDALADLATGNPWMPPTTT